MDPIPPDRNDPLRPDVLGDLVRTILTGMYSFHYLKGSTMTVGELKKLLEHLNDTAIVRVGYLSATAMYAEDDVDALFSFGPSFPEAEHVTICGESCPTPTDGNEV